MDPIRWDRYNKLASHQMERNMSNIGQISAVETIPVSYFLIRKHYSGENCSIAIKPNQLLTHSTQYLFIQFVSMEYFQRIAGKIGISLKREKIRPIVPRN